MKSTDLVTVIKQAADNLNNSIEARDTYIAQLENLVKHYESAIEIKDRYIALLEKQAALYDDENVCDDEDL
jgi:SMC interacting uncharacterized protein involved in chromosome segregation